MVFGADRRAGRLLDLVLRWVIVASVAVVMLDSVAARWRCFWASWVVDIGAGR